MKNEKVQNLLKGALNSSNSVIALLIAFFIGGIMVIIVGENPLNAYSAILAGAFGSATAVRNTIRFAIQVLILGYSFSVCNRCGYFNISQEAQMYGASLALVYTSQATLGLPTVVRWPLMIIASVAVGALICLLPALFKFKLGVNEIITGVMLNYLLKFVNQHLIAFGSIAGTRTSSISSVDVPEKLPVPVITVSAVLIIIAFYFVLRNTIPGFKLTVTGKNDKFSRASGINVTKVIITAAIVGGALSAFCMLSELLGYYGQIYNEFANGMGNSGLTVAFIGNNTPIGMVFGSIMLGALKSGSILLSVRTRVPSELIDCIQGLIMFFATIKFYDASRVKFGVKPEEVKAATAEEEA